MPVRENILFINNIPSWFQGAATVQGYMWCVQGGAIVAGSNSVPSAIPIIRTGNSYSDISDWITGVMADFTADIPAGTPIIDPPAVFVNGWGVVGLESTGPGLQRPGIYLWAGVSYDFGLLNLSPQEGEANARDWFIKFTAEATAAEAVPAWPIITDYIANHGGANPILHVAELKSIE